MQLRRNFVRNLIFGRGVARASRVRRKSQVVLSCDSLEGRVAPAHLGLAHHAIAHLHTAAHHAQQSQNSTTVASTTTTVASSTSIAPTSTSVAPTSTSIASNNESTGSNNESTQSTNEPTESNDGSTESGGTEGSSNPALSAAYKALQSDVQTIQLASGTTVGQLTAIRGAFHTLRSDGVSLTSESALASFENSLVTTNATTPGSLTPGTSTGDALQSQFLALYTPTATSTPPLTTQQTTDLDAAYTALAAAVTSAGITSMNIATINADWTTVLAAQTPPGSTSTTYPYFNLVIGAGEGLGGWDGGWGHGGDR